ncbi:MAG: hypothetical protein QOF03_1325, partial [Alphaproteobacteria bacterium]|nr:hypothetical protein [Alphaproteobacteria bacterium]
MHSVARLDVVIASGIGLETVIARSEATKQSIVTLSLAMDCFASLAMTVSKPSWLFEIEVDVCEALHKLALRNALLMS